MRNYRLCLQSMYICYLESIYNYNEQYGLVYDFISFFLIVRARFEDV